MAFEFPDPALGDLVDRHRIEVVQLLAAALDGGDQIGLLQNPQVLAHGLPRHVETRAELVERLSVVGPQAVEQFPAARIGQRPEHLIHDDNMQPFGCLSSNTCRSRGHIVRGAVLHFHAAFLANVISRMCAFDAVDGSSTGT